MLVAVLLSQMGLGTEYAFDDGNIALTGAQGGVYYDGDGTSKLNATTLEPLNSSEKITIVREDTTGVALWYNDTNLIHTYYGLYTDTGGADAVFYHELGRSQNAGGGSEVGVSISDSFGFIAVVVGIVALVSIVGFQVLGSGESEVSVAVITMFTGLLAFWTILSLGGLPLITSIPTFGVLLYVVLTAMYSIGCFKAISGVNE